MRAWSSVREKEGEVKISRPLSFASAMTNLSSAPVVRTAEKTPLPLCVVSVPAAVKGAGRGDARRRE